MAGTAPKKARKDAKALIAARRPAERSVDICMRADLRRRMGELSRELTEAEGVRAASGSLASGTRSRDLAEQLDALHAEMIEATVTFAFRAMPRREWRALGVAHPPRDDNRTDAMFGVNEDSFFGAAIRQSCVSPELDDETWQSFLDDVADVEWMALRDAVRMVNQEDVDVPFSRAASRILQASETN
jgi:hypothetical protein